LWGEKGDRELNPSNKILPRRGGGEERENQPFRFSPKKKRGKEGDSLKKGEGGQTEKKGKIQKTKNQRISDPRGGKRKKRFFFWKF